MIFISHRGNLDKREPELENDPGYINAALSAGFDVEVDVWYDGINGFWLGHDKPEYKTSLSFLDNEYLWVHAKNISALKELVEAGIHCFFHDRDECTLTSRGFIWTYPGKQITPMSICLFPSVNEFYPHMAGVCSDEIVQYKKMFEKCRGTNTSAW